MSRWGNKTYNEDVAMDIVGCIWDDLLLYLDRSRLIEIIDPFLAKCHPDHLPYMLWTFCKTELPDILLYRIASLLSSSVPLGQAIINSIRRDQINDTLKSAYYSTPAAQKQSAAAAISYFCIELGFAIDINLWNTIAHHFDDIMSSFNDSTARIAVQAEIGMLRDLSK